jgi:hypothetical protein
VFEITIADSIGAPQEPRSAMSGSDQRFAALGVLAGYRSGKKSRPLTISTAFFSAPTNGIALKPVSSVPLTTPFRRIVDRTVAAAIAVPRTGIDRRNRRDNLAPPHLVSFCPILMDNGRSK